MFYDSELRASGDGDPGLPWNPFKALVAPRPIGWVSTLTPGGAVNLAPFSYFQAVADRPDVVVFSADSRVVLADRGLCDTGQRKDTDLNAAVGGEFVCSLVSWDLREAMNQTSLHLGREDSEADRAGIALAPSRRVRPPRVAAAPAALECVVVDVRPVPHRRGPHRYHMVFGEVLGIHIEDAFVEQGRVDTTAMQLVSRMGYDEYTVTRDSFRMTRPELDPIADELVR